MVAVRIDVKILMEATDVHAEVDSNSAATNMNVTVSPILHQYYLSSLYCRVQGKQDQAPAKATYPSPQMNAHAKTLAHSWIRPLNSVLPINDSDTANSFNQN